MIRAGLHLGLLAVAALAVSRVAEVASTDLLNFAIWLVAGAILHDALLLPMYIAGDLVSRVALGDNDLLRVRAINHVRVPAIVAFCLLLVGLPGILGRTAESFERVSGRAPATDPLTAWLLITAGLFAASALIYAVRRARA